MEHKSSTFRHFNCLSLSILLHSLLIAGLTLAPAMLLKKGNGEGDGATAIDLAVVSNEENAAENNVTPPQPVVAEPAPQPEVVNPEPAPVVTKPKPKPLAKKEVMPKPEVIETAPETVEPQPVVEVAETVNETEPSSESVAYDKVDEDALPLTQEEIEEAQQVAQNQVPVQESVQEPQSTVQEPEPTPIVQAAAPAATPADSSEGTQTPGGQQGESKVASQGSPQNFLTLQQMAGNKPPQYTREMRLKRLEGRGQLTYYVTKEGIVTDIKLTQSTGHEELDRAAIEAFSKYRFVPGQEGYTVHNFEFALTGPAERDAGRLRTSKQ